MAVSKKQLKAIKDVSYALKAIKDSEGRLVSQFHWTDTPPDMWNDDEKAKWDLLFDLEEKIKDSIIKILTKQ